MLDYSRFSRVSAPLCADRSFLTHEHKKRVVAHPPPPPHHFYIIATGEKIFEKSQVGKKFNKLCSSRTESKGYSYSNTVYTVQLHFILARKWLKIYVFNILLVHKPKKTKNK
jgi:hypothetical protein